MRKEWFVLSALLMVVVLISQVTALAPERVQRLKFGPTLYITDVYTEPVEIAPGSTAVLKITLENIEDFLLKDVKITLDLPSQFAPIREITEKKIRRISGKEIVEVNFSVIALPAAKSGVYKVNLTIEYLDEIGESYTESNVISFIIGATPQFFAKIESSEIYEGNKMGTVVISLVNNGVADIKFLTAELQESGDYEILTANKVYVGELDSDDYETMDFRLKVTGEKTEINLPLMLDYADANNKKYEEVLEVTLDIRSAEEAGIQESNAGLWISIFAGLLIIYFIYRRLKKKVHRK